MNLWFLYSFHKRYESNYYSGVKVRNLIVTHVPKYWVWRTVGSKSPVYRYLLLLTNMLQNIIGLSMRFWGQNFQIRLYIYT